MKRILLAVRAGAAVLLFTFLCQPLLGQSSATLSERLVTAIQHREPSWKIVEPVWRQISPEPWVQIVLEGEGHQIRVNLVAHVSDTEALASANRANQFGGPIRTAAPPSPERTAWRNYSKANVVITIIVDSHSLAQSTNTTNRSNPTIVVDKVARIINDLISTDVKADACVNELFADPRPEPASRLDAFFRDVEAGCLPRVQQALLDGVDANARDSQRTTALMLAVAAGRRDVTQALLQSGADPQAVAGATGTAMFRVFTRPSTYKGEDLPKILANQLAILDDLLAAGAKLETRDHYGRTLLLQVARMNYDDGSAIIMLNGLIERGVDVSARDREGRSALIHAVMHTAPKIQVETLPVLLAAGIEANAVDVFGKMALDYANERADTFNAREWQRVISFLADPKR